MSSFFCVLGRVSMRQVKFIVLLYSSLALAGNTQEGSGGGNPLANPIPPMMTSQQPPLAPQPPVSQPLSSDVIESANRFEEINLDDNVTSVPIDLNSIPDPDESLLGYTFQSTGQQRDEVIQLYKNLYKIDPCSGKQIAAQELGLISTQEADQSYHSGELEVGNCYKELGKGFLNISVGLDPVSQLARSVYEFFLGKNLITGKHLTLNDRIYTFIGAFGLTSHHITQAGPRMMAKIYERAAHLFREREAIQDALRHGTEYIEK